MFTSPRRRGLSVLLVAAIALSPLIGPSGSGAAAAELDRYNGPLALIRNGGTELWTSWPDGSGLTQILQGYSGLADPTWSPDGSRFAFSSDRSGKPQIYVANADGSGAVSISDGTSADRAPAWSPNGDLIAFNRGYEVDDGFYEIWVMNPTGGSARPLVADTTSPDTTDGVTSGRGTGTAGVPSWSPDGSSVLFSGTVTSSYEDSSGGANPYQECCAIFGLNVSTGSLRQITTGASYYYEPSYSPDGIQIVFSTGNNGIGVMAADGSGERRVDTGLGFTVGCYAEPGGTYDPATCDSDLTFTPEGQIAWTSTNPPAVVMQSLDGSGRRQVTGATGFAWRSTPVRRLAGADRTATAVAVSRSAFPGPGAAAAVVLSRADKYADALAGTTLAEGKGGPLLLSDSGTLTDASANELKRVLPRGKTVYLLGGTAALGPEVEAQVRALGYSPVRLAGIDRFETAVAVARDGLGSRRKAFVASGLSHAEALVAAVAAAHVGGVVLLTADGTMPASTQRYLDTLAPTEAYLVGTARGTYPGQAIDGSTPAETAAALARRFFATPARVAIASSTAFPDALSGGAHAARNAVPLLLVGDSVTAAAGFIAESQPRGVFIYGGTAVISRDIEAAVERTVRS